MIAITLKEYETYPPNDGLDLNLLKEVRGLKLEEKDKKLQEELKDILSINSNPLHGGLQFKAQSHVGVAQFSNFFVSIIPKFSEIKKLIELIDYVYDLDLATMLKNESMFEGETNMISEIIISIFVKNCQRLIRQGMFKSYNIREDNLSFLRGKLLVSQQIRNQARVKLQFSCEYDDFEYNNLDNQIILYCLKQSYYLTHKDKRKSEIRALIQDFSDLVDENKISLDDFSKINYNQMNSHYKKTHELCRLIVENIKITDFYKQELRYINSFFIDMNNLFEKFIFKLFDKYHPLKCKKQQYYSTWIVDGTNEKIHVIPDILIFKKNTHDVKAIIDTKYKDKLSRDDLFQIAHYVRDYEKIIGYAVLPKTETSEPSTLKGQKQDIEINICYIDVDKILDLIHPNKIYEQEIREYLLKLVPEIK